MMAYLCSLLLIVILTVASGAVSLYCSDVGSPAASGSGHNTDLSQVTTLQYCTIDNCTIMRIDTGQQLDIVYTTESLLIVTPKDGKTSMVIAKADDEFPCLEYFNTVDDSQVIQYASVTLTLLVMLISAYTLIVHLLLKSHRSLFRKLLMFYNLNVVCICGAVLVLALMHYWVAVNSHRICHTVTIAFIIGHIGSASFGTIIQSYLAYVMYRCYHLKSKMSKKTSGFLFRCYAAYANTALILMLFVVIAYDWRTGNDKHTILKTGHCFYIGQPTSYNTLLILHSFIVINKVLQFMMFLAYLVYYYKFNMNVRAAQVTLQYGQKLVRIAVAMGGSVGIAYLIHIVVRLFIPEYIGISFISSSVLVLIQQTVIMVCFMCTKKMYTLCKKSISRD